MSYKSLGWLCVAALCAGGCGVQPENPRHAARREDDIDRATRCIEEGVDPSGRLTSEELIYRASLYVDAGEYQKALADVDRAIDAEPHCIAPREQKIAILMRMGRRADAAAVYDELIAIDSTRGGDHYAGKAAVLLQAQDYDAALEAVNRALQNVPTTIEWEDPRSTRASYLRLRAMIYEAQGEMNRASADLREADRLDKEVWGG